MYSQIISSINSTWKKGVEFAWTEDCQDIFDILKDLIMTAPALLPINYMCKRPIIISVDSSYIYGCRNDSVPTRWEKQTPTIQIWITSLYQSGSYIFPTQAGLYGLFCTLRHFHLYIIKAKNLIVEVDSKYVHKGNVKWTRTSVQCCNQQMDPRCSTVWFYSGTYPCHQVQRVWCTIPLPTRREHRSRALWWYLAGWNSIVPQWLWILLVPKQWTVGCNPQFPWCLCTDSHGNPGDYPKEDIWVPYYPCTRNNNS